MIWDGLIVFVFIFLIMAAAHRFHKLTLGLKSEFQDIQPRVEVYKKKRPSIKKAITNFLKRLYSRKENM